jgi:hypothetical protein
MDSEAVSQTDLDDAAVLRQSLTSGHLTLSLGLDTWLSGHALGLDLGCLDMHSVWISVVRTLGLDTRLSGYSLWARSERILELIGFTDRLEGSRGSTVIILGRCVDDFILLYKDGNVVMVSVNTRVTDHPPAHDFRTNFDRASDTGVQSSANAWTV